jgi:hypothetical protein
MSTTKDENRDGYARRKAAAGDETQPITEHRVREIVAEMIDRWQEEVVRNVDTLAEGGAK